MQSQALTAASQHSNRNSRFVNYTALVPNTHYLSELFLNYPAAHYSARYAGPQQIICDSTMNSLGWPAIPPLSLPLKKGVIEPLFATTGYILLRKNPEKNEIPQMRLLPESDFFKMSLHIYTPKKRLKVLRAQSYLTSFNHENISGPAALNYQIEGNKQWQYTYVPCTYSKHRSYYYQGYFQAEHESYLDVFANPYESEIRRQSVNTNQNEGKGNKLPGKNPRFYNLFTSFASFFKRYEAELNELAQLWTNLPLKFSEKYWYSFKRRYQLLYRKMMGQKAYLASILRRNYQYLYQYGDQEHVKHSTDKVSKYQSDFGEISVKLKTKEEIIRQLEEDNNRLKANIGDIEKEKIKLEIQKELKEEELVTLRKRINRQYTDRSNGTDLCASKHSRKRKIGNDCLPTAHSSYRNKCNYINLTAIGEDKKRFHDRRGDNIGRDKRKEKPDWLLSVLLEKYTEINELKRQIHKLKQQKYQEPIRSNSPNVYSCASEHDEQSGSKRCSTENVSGTYQKQQWTRSSRKKRTKQHTSLQKQNNIPHENPQPSFEGKIRRIRGEIKRPVSNTNTSKQIRHNCHIRLHPSNDDLLITRPFSLSQKISRDHPADNRFQYITEYYEEENRISHMEEIVSKYLKQLFPSSFDSFVSKANVPLSLREFQMLRETFPVVDTRSEIDFGIIENAYWLPGISAIKSYVKDILHPEQTFIIFCENGYNQYIIEAFVQSGYVNIQGYNGFKVVAWPLGFSHLETLNFMQSLSEKNSTHLSLETENDTIGKNTIDSIAIPLYLLYRRIGELKNCNKIHMYSSQGVKAQIAFSILMRHGVKSKIIYKLNQKS